MNGFEAAKWIVEEWGSEHSPVILAITGDISTGVVQRYLFTPTPTAL